MSTEQQNAAIIQLVTLAGQAAKNAYDHWQSARDLALQAGITEADLDKGDARFLKEYIPKPPDVQPTPEPVPTPTPVPQPTPQPTPPPQPTPTPSAMYNEPSTGALPSDSELKAKGYKSRDRKFVRAVPPSYLMLGTEGEAGQGGYSKPSWPGFVPYGEIG